MAKNDPPSFEPPESAEHSPTSQQLELSATETLEINGLFGPDITDSGSFDIGTDIWAGTFGKLLKVLPLPVLIIDQFRDVVVANPAWRDISTRYEQMLGRPLFRLFPNRSDALEAESLITDVFSTRKTASWEASLEIDGNKLWGRLTFRSIRMHGQRYQLILIEDRSAEKQRLLSDRKFRRDLETQVRERTDELRRKNEALLREIAERELAERAAEESRQRVELAMQGGKLGLWDWNLKTGRPNWDTRTVEMLGYSSDEIQLDLRVLKSLVHPEDWPGFSARLNDHLDGRLPSFSVECRHQCKSGEWKWFFHQGKVVEYDTNGKPLRMTGTWLDITERKLIELEREALRAQLFQAQKMESIGTLAGGIAHDFNNLLTVVQGFSELLVLDTDEHNPIYPDLFAINQAARKGSDLVRRILAFSRKAEMNPQPLNLNHSVEQAAKLLSRTIPKMVEIRLLLSDEPVTINADPTQVEQILMNLVVNANDAMPAGGKLTIETKSVALDNEFCSLNVGARPGDYVLLSVSDTGQGMDEEVLRHIFEPFFTTKESGRGTGLGLAVVYGIVKQHGGYIACRSRPGVGSTFLVYLPAIPKESKQEPSMDELPLPGGTGTVLVVDDEEMIREYGKRILVRSGYTVLTAGDGRAALDLYKKETEKISLVILDLIMPEMGGRQCLDLLLKIDPRVKVLISSGDTGGGGVKEAVRAGAVGFVAKPYDIKQLLGSVRRALDSPSKDEGEN